MTPDIALSPSKVVWLTGLSGSGKSTIAQELKRTLQSQEFPVKILDGDVLRTSVNKDLGFSKEDRVENIRRTALLAKSLVDSGIVVIVALISPYIEGRQRARELFQEGQFIEVFIDTPLEICIQRDPKGLYAKALKGEIKNFTGIYSSYEAPTDPEVTLITERNSVKETVEIVIEYLNIGAT